MQITTPSGYVVDFKDEADLTYGDRRQIKKAMLRTLKLNPETDLTNVNFTGDVLMDSQDETLRVILKSIKKPDGTMVTGDLFTEVQHWTNEADGDAVYTALQSVQSPKAPQTPPPALP